MKTSLASPLDLLLPYQRRFFDDTARWKVWCTSRQIGKDFTTSGEIVRDCMLCPATTWMYAAPSERQSLESLAKCKEWAEAFRFAIADILEERSAPGALMSNATIVFPNKSRIICVPVSPSCRNPRLFTFSRKGLPAIALRLGNGGHKHATIRRIWPLFSICFS